MLAITPVGASMCIIRPVPFISITQNAIRNEKGILGSYYDITLTGTLLAELGSPFGKVGLQGGADILNLDFQHAYGNPARSAVTTNAAMGVLLRKQNSLRELFRRDGSKYEIYPNSIIPNSDPATPADNMAVIIFYPTVQSINFEEGIYVNQCKYTVNLRAEVLLDSSGFVISDGLTNSTYANYDSSGPTDLPLNLVVGGVNQVDKTTDIIRDRQNLDTMAQIYGFIEDYTENWAIEVDEGRGITDTPTVVAPIYDHEKHLLSQRAYRLTRNVTVKGRTIYRHTQDGQRSRYEAWQQARTYILKVVLRDRNDASTDNSSGYENYPELQNSVGHYASGLLNLEKNGGYAGYNHLRTMSIDETGGSVTLTETWVLSSGTSNEDYNMSLNRTYDSPIHKVTINGTIKGLCSHNAASKYYGGTVSQTNNIPGLDSANFNTAYTNAVRKWHLISNSGKYGPTCHLFRRAESITHLPLNHVPLSVALSPNEFTGEIGYAVDYDTRPMNLVSGTLQEDINCSDTYPGDVFAVIPVIGRKTGPILQYIGGRTEYQRSLSIDLTFEQYWTSSVPPNGNTYWLAMRQFSVLSKPSLNEPYRTQIHDIVSAYSPANETGVRKYFLNPPQETWDVKTGKYTLNLNWTYELNR